MSENASTKKRNFNKTWTFWLTIFDFTSSKFQYTIEEIGSISKLHNLYLYYKTLPQIHEIKRNVRHYASIAFFCDKIKPAWEDERNKNGASYNFTVTEKVADNLWRDLLLCACGDLFTFKIPNDLSGIVVSPKKDRNIYEFEIWVKTYTTEPCKEVLQLICNLESLKNYKDENGVSLTPDSIRYNKLGQQY